MTRRRILIVILAFVLLSIGYAAWTLADLPPVKYVLRYGFSPGCEPTGERITFEGVTFVEIGPGAFRMGSTHLAEGGDWLGKLCAPFGLPWGKQAKPSNEMPVHWVEFRQGFWIATTEITNAQFKRFDPKHAPGGYSKCDDQPVVEVSWDKARAYCAWLAKISGRPIRLPSEAEWECACRAGSDDEYCFGNDEDDLSEYAWYDVDWRGRTYPVARKRPNRWGLYDVHGNVWEWCEDTYHESYEDAPTDGSSWTEGGVEWEPGVPARVERGGGWINPAGSCRSAYRYKKRPSFRSVDLSFRPAFVRIGD